MGFLFKLFTGGFGLVANYAMIGGLVLIIGGFLYSQFVNKIAEEARLKFQVQQLEDIIDAKNDVIELQQALNELASKLAQENVDAVEAAEEANRAIQETLNKREDGGNPSSEYLKEYFRLLNGKNDE